MVVYRLHIIHSHLVDMTYDVDVLHLSESEKNILMINLMDEAPIKLESRLDFLGNFNTIFTHTDFPKSTKFYPVFNLKVVEILKEQGSKHFNLYPIMVQDDSWYDTYPTIESRYDEKGNIKPEIKVSHDFCILQPTNILDVINLDKSDYKPKRERQKYPSVFYKLVLNEPVGGFPPIFRLKYEKRNLYINEQAKNAFEKANIKGCRFIPIEVISRST